ncbi:hypothetical protein EYC80_005248 [Monilinia laxa]|uniref:Uncharacterized protein n=1 Tax=Monilinia laxa TaxID=61186 RepID=A0A5N6KJK7_MONLA|nr:hypothetical protein EYC80_005248 [Monilinia laxa]
MMVHWYGGGGARNKLGVMSLCLNAELDLITLRCVAIRYHPTFFNYPCNTYFTLPLHHNQVYHACEHISSS